MDSLQWRSFSRELSLAYARDQIERFQRLLERFRLCECHELGGEECNCVNENVRKDLIRYQRFIQHRSTQTDEMNGKFDIIKHIYH